jgi:hypothetical protein
LQKKIKAPFFLLQLSWLFFRSLKGHAQGCQMVCFQTKNTNLGKKFLGPRLGHVDMFYAYLGYFMPIRYILCALGTFSGFGIMLKEKSGNPGHTVKGSPLQTMRPIRKIKIEIEFQINKKNIP